MTEALTDRYCTMANVSVHLSATDTAFCCTACGAGCGGGDPEKALDYLNSTGAFTSTCHSAHVPSFIRTKDALAAKGVEEVICISVNDPFVMGTWGEATGASAAGITMLGDAESTFTKAIGMEFSAAPVGLMERSKRYAMVVEDGKVTLLHEEENPGACEVSAGEAIVAAL